MYLEMSSPRSQNCYGCHTLQIDLASFLSEHRIVSRSYFLRNKEWIDRYFPLVITVGTGVVVDATFCFTHFSMSLSITSLEAFMAYIQKSVI